MFLDLGWPEPTLALCVNRMHDCEARKKSPEDYPKVRGIPRKSHGFRILCHGRLSCSAGVVPYSPR